MNRPLEKEALSVMLLKVTTETVEQSVTMKMTAKLLYGPDIEVEIEPDTAVYVRRPVASRP